MRNTQRCEKQADLVERKNERSVFLGAVTVFTATYIPLMVKFYKVFTDKE